MVPQTKGEPAQPRNCVLVVDDDPLVRQLIAEAMRDSGWCVIEARSGEDAINYLNAGARVDVIFSDVQMPGAVDGVHLARHVNEKYPAIPVILTSGKLRPPGYTGQFVPKPYSISHVLTLVTDILKSLDEAPP